MIYRNNWEKTSMSEPTPTRLVCPDIHVTWNDTGLTGFSEDSLVEFPNDTLRIVNVMFYRGYSVDPVTASRLWGIVSRESDAHWLELPFTDRQVFSDINDFCFNSGLVLPDGA
jgi:hypothetical protein